MKKIFSTLFPLIMMIIASIACAGIYMFFTNKFGQKDIQNNVNANQNVVKDDSSVVLSEEELPRLESSVSAKPLANAIVVDFTQNKNLSETVLDYSADDKGYEKLLNGQVDILIATEPSNEVLSLVQASGAELDMQLIAKEGFVFYVNSKNPVDSLEVSEIQQIYTGRISNWSQVGGKDEDIMPFQRVEGSTDQRQMISKVMKSLTLMSPPMYNFRDKVYGNINDVVATYDNSENAIGYSLSYQANIMYDSDDTTSDPIKFLKINNFEPNYDNIKNESYPFITNYYLVKLKNNNNEYIDAFTQAVFSDRGKRIIKEAGYIDN